MKCWKKSNCQIFCPRESRQRFWFKSQLVSEKNKSFLPWCRLAETRFCDNSRRIPKHFFVDSCVNWWKQCFFYKKKYWIRLYFTFTKLGGQIEVYIGDSVYKPLISVADEKALAVQYVSFDSLETSRVLFFYECADRHAVSPSVQPPAHPLLAETDVATKEGKFAQPRVFT